MVKAISTPMPIVIIGWRNNICPHSLQGKVFYQPSEEGYEAQIRTEVAQRREAQLAAMLEVEESGIGPMEVLTFSPNDLARERWLQRTISNTGERLAAHAQPRLG